MYDECFPSKYSNQGNLSRGLDPVRLTTRIRYHREKIFILDCSLKRRFHDCGEGVVTEHEAAGHPVFTLQVSDRGEVSATNET